MWSSASRSPKLARKSAPCQRAAREQTCASTRLCRRASILLYRARARCMISRTSSRPTLGLASREEPLRCGAVDVDSRDLLSHHLLPPPERAEPKDDAELRIDHQLVFVPTRELKDDEVVPARPLRRSKRPAHQDGLTADHLGSRPRLQPQLADQQGRIPQLLERLHLGLGRLHAPPSGHARCEAVRVGAPPHFTVPTLFGGREPDAPAPRRCDPHPDLLLLHTKRLQHRPVAHVRVAGAEKIVVYPHVYLELEHGVAGTTTGPDSAGS